MDDPFSPSSEPQERKPQSQPGTVKLMIDQLADHLDRKHKPTNSPQFMNISSEMGCIMNKSTFCS